MLILVQEDKEKAMLNLFLRWDLRL